MIKRWRTSLMVGVLCLVVAAGALAQGAGKSLIGKLEGPEVVTDPAKFPKTFKEAPQFAEQVKAGKMRALAQSSPSKLDGIPSLKEQGIDVELGNWRGIFGGPGITPQQRDALVKLVKDATETPAWKATLEKLGWTPVFLGGDDYGKFIDEDIKRVGAIIESLGLKK